MVFAVYENPSDAIPDIVGPVVFKGISQEVEDMDDSAIGTALILPDITAFHNQLVARDFEHIRMHKKNQDIRAEFELKLKCTSVAVFKQNGERRPSCSSFVRIDKFFAFSFKNVKNVKSFVINLLL